MLCGKLTDSFASKFVFPARLLPSPETKKTQGYNSLKGEQTDTGKFTSNLHSLSFWKNGYERKLHSDCG